MIKVSIIVPIYNVEKYLRKCLESCLNQTLEEIEVIAVNDASPDNSNIIMIELKEEYPDKMTNVFLKENVRQGGARNEGIRIARGEYLCFVDGDDYIDEDTCRVLYEYAKINDCDIVGCDGYYIKNDKKSYISIYNHWNTTELANINRLTSQCYKIIKKDIITNNDLFYPLHIFHEDTSVVPLWHLCADKIGYVPCPLFYINRHSDSSSNSHDAKDNFQILSALEILVSNSVKLNLYERYKKQIDKFIISRIIVFIERYINGHFIINEQDAIYSKTVAYWRNYTFEKSVWENGYTEREKKLVEDFQREVLHCTYTNGYNYYLDPKNKLRELLVEYEDYSIIVFGVGNKGLAVIETLDKLGANFMVADNNSQLINKKILGKYRVHSKSEIENICQNKVYFIASQVYFKDIVLSLEIDSEQAIDIITFMECAIDYNDWCTHERVPEYMIDDTRDFIGKE